MPLECGNVPHRVLLSRIRSWPDAPMVAFMAELCPVRAQVCVDTWQGGVFLNECLRYSDAGEKWEMRILVIEDNGDVGEGIVESVERWAICVDWARNGRPVTNGFCQIIINLSCSTSCCQVWTA